MQTPRSKPLLALLAVCGLVGRVAFGGGPPAEMPPLLPEAEEIQAALHKLLRDLETFKQQNHKGL